MTNGGDPRSELRAAIDSMAEDRARTLLGWLRTDRSQREDTAASPPPERLDAPSPFLDRPDAPTGESIGPLGDLLGIRADVRQPGYSRMRLTVDPRFFNPNGVLHGGVVYTLIDSSMGGAVSSGLPEDEHCATIEVKVSYLLAVREGTLTVETHVIKQGRNIAFTESKVLDDARRLAATATGSMFIFRGDEE